MHGIRLVMIGMLASMIAGASGCDRGPEQRLVGEWVVDIEASREEMRERMDAAGQEDGPTRALTEGLMAGVAQQNREYAFSRNGTVRARILGPSPAGTGGRITLHSAEGQWQVIDASDDALTVRITSDDSQQLDGWEHQLHFLGDDRLYYRTEEDGIRHYWQRKE